MSTPNRKSLMRTLVATGHIITFVAAVITAVQTIVVFLMFVWQALRPKRAMGFSKASTKRRRDERRKRKCDTEEDRQAPAPGDKQEEGEAQACE